MVEPEQPRKSSLDSFLKLQLDPLASIQYLLCGNAKIRESEKQGDQGGAQED